MNENPTVEVNKLQPITKFIYTLGVLPTSYLMSMTFQEQLTWLCNYLSQTVIPAINDDVEAVQELQQLYEDLQDYVNNYFDNLDVQDEINEKLDKMAQDGSLTALISGYVQPIQTAFESEVRTTLSNFETQIDSIASGSPAGVYATAEALATDDPDHSKIYLVLADGKWYYHDGTSWTAGGTYQATTVSDNSVTLDNLNTDVKFNLNQRINNKDVYNLTDETEIDLTDNLINGIVNTSTGKIDTRTDNIYFVTPNFYFYPENSILNLNLQNTYHVRISWYDKDFNYIKDFLLTSTGNNALPIINKINEAKYFRLRIYLKSGETTTISDIISAIDLKLVNIDTTLKTNIGTNLFNPNKYYTGYLVANANSPYMITVLENTTYRTTYPIPVEANKPYFIRRFRQFMLYDSNFEYVSGSAINADTQNYIFTPSGNGYVVFSYNSTYVDGEIMAQSGSAVSYVPYREYLPDYIDLSNLIESDNSDVLYGKKYVTLGDSFTHGDFSNSPTQDYTITEGLYSGQYKVYPFLIGNRLNMNITNLAQNGMTITNINGSSTNYLSDDVLEQIPEDVDYITIKIGINDNPDHQNAPLGTIQSSDRTTFYGAWNYVMNYLITNYPNAKIGIIVSNGMTSNDFINAEIEIAKRYGVAFINETTDNNVPLLIRTMRTDVLQSIKTLRNNTWEVLPGTNSHPNAKCHEFESTIIENFLRSL